ncbi:MAG: Bax inhibitor-1/YccA family protein [Clostridiales bacterium]|nr:Bax inhibitor-1/YccA family protein [Eubacteriales bacterium]MDH7567237.1 Bax inhibitor-1/YccA family protein [Clostridiales bacterium]
MKNGFNDYNRYDADVYAIRQRAGLSRYLSGVFAWMFLGLLVTAFTAFYCAGSYTLISAMVSNPLLLIGMAVAEFALVLYLSARIMKMGYKTAVSLFILYSALNGITLSVVLLAFTLSSVAYAFAITSATFGFMSIYGYITRTDLTKAGNILFMGLVGLVILSLVNMFLHISSVEWLISVLGLFVFLGLAAYDTQKIKRYYYEAAGNYEAVRKTAIMGALQLYLDFINLFLILLRLVGRRR